MVPVVSRDHVDDLIRSRRVVQGAEITAFLKRRKCVTQTLQQFPRAEGVKSHLLSCSAIEFENNGWTQTSNELSGPPKGQFLRPLHIKFNKPYSLNTFFLGQSAESVRGYLLLLEFESRRPRTSQ